MEPASPTVAPAPQPAQLGGAVVAYERGLRRVSGALPCLDFTPPISLDCPARPAPSSRQEAVDHYQVVLAKLARAGVTFTEVELPRVIDDWTELLLRARATRREEPCWTPEASTSQDGGRFEDDELMDESMPSGDVETDEQERTSTAQIVSPVLQPAIAAAADSPVTHAHAAQREDEVEVAVFLKEVVAFVQDALSQDDAPDADFYLSGSLVLQPSEFEALSGYTVTALRAADLLIEASSASRALKLSSRVQQQLDAVLMRLAEGHSGAEDDDDDDDDDDDADADEAGEPEVAIGEPDAVGLDPEPEAEAEQEQEQGEVLQVDKILGERKREGRNEFLLSWVGYGSWQNSWEPEANILDPALIPEYRMIQGAAADAEAEAADAEAEAEVEEEAETMEAEVEAEVDAEADVDADADADGDAHAGSSSVFTHLTTELDAAKCERDGLVKALEQSEKQRSVAEKKRETAEKKQGSEERRRKTAEAQLDKTRKQHAALQEQLRKAAAKLRTAPRSSSAGTSTSTAAAASAAAAPMKWPADATLLLCGNHPDSKASRSIVLGKNSGPVIKLQFKNAFCGTPEATIMRMLDKAPAINVNMSGDQSMEWCRYDAVRCLIKQAELALEHRNLLVVSYGKWGETLRNLSFEPEAMFNPELRVTANYLKSHGFTNYGFGPGQFPLDFDCDTRGRAGFLRSTILGTSVAKVVVEDGRRKGAYHACWSPHPNFIEGTIQKALLQFPVAMLQALGSHETSLPELKLNLPRLRKIEKKLKPKTKPVNAKATKGQGKASRHCPRKH